MHICKRALMQKYMLYVFAGVYNVETSLCSCDESFYDESCSSTCYVDDTGAICSGHGTCHSVSGDCICELQWRGDDHCGSCTQGYSGKTTF